MDNQHKNFIIDNIKTALSSLNENTLHSDLSNIHKSIETLIDYSTEEYIDLYDVSPIKTINAESDNFIELSKSLKLRKLSNFNHYLKSIYTLLSSIDNAKITDIEIKSKIDNLSRPYEDGIDGVLIYPFFNNDGYTIFELVKAITNNIKNSLWYIDTNFNSKLNKQAHEISELTKVTFDSKNIVNEVKLAIENYIDDSENRLQSLIDETNNLLAIQGEESLIKGHLDQANKERDVSTKLRNWAIFFLTLSSLSAIYTLFQLQITNTEIQINILRLIASLIISLPGIYLIKESNSHKKDERHYRDLGLDLAAIPPYLRDFDSDTTKELKKDLSQKLFAKQREITANTVPVDYQKLIEAILQNAVNNSKDKK
ncbi:hypothetical protein [Photobacterium leiognathi]|uniref:hypothetical protein n=1 Tax=Photobacterium leiognathi TaxID=553611 RepID=UPI00076A356D|nr:hypothetical protein [Photobacterium leiognathi]